MRKNKKENKDDSWIYILLLTTLLILTESIKNFKFTVLDVKLTYALFLLPIAYFLINFIAKKYNYKRAVVAIAVSDRFDDQIHLLRICIQFLGARCNNV